MFTKAKVSLLHQFILCSLQNNLCVLFVFINGPLRFADAFFIAINAHVWILYCKVLPIKIALAKHAVDVWRRMD